MANSVQIATYDGADVKPTNPLPIRAASGGYYATATFTPAAAAYTGMDIMSVAQPLVWTDAAGNAFAGGELVIIGSTLQVYHTALETSETSYLGAFYTVTPPSARADNAAWTLASADRSAIQGDPMGLGTPVAYTTTLSVEALQQKPITVNTIGKSYMELITVATFTVGGTGRSRAVYLHAVPA